jgi:hypothetical protein
MHLDPTYLPFSAEQLRHHFASTSGRSADEQAARQPKYYLNSAERYHRFQADHPDRRGLPLSKLRTPCQIERDERFWIVACLMSYSYKADRTERFGALMHLGYGDTPPLRDVTSWDECLDGKLHLFFEVNLPSPLGYKRWLMDKYRTDPTTLVRDIPHRQSVDWLEVSSRLGWLTWDDCERVLPGSCPWLTRKLRQ